jgi:hypothetical protein
VPNEPAQTHCCNPPANFDTNHNPFSRDGVCQEDAISSSSELGEEVVSPGKPLENLPLPLGADIKLPVGTDTAQQDEAYLFHHRNSGADLGHWTKLPVWTLDEVVSLSLGKNPDLIDWDLVELYRDDIPLAKELWDRRRLVHRYKEIGRLSDTVFPNDFIEWAHHTETDLPSALKDAVAARWQQAVDWRQLCYDQKAYYDELVGKWKSACDAIDGERQELAAKVSSLLTAIEVRDHSVSQLRECQHLLEGAYGEARGKAEVDPDRPLHTKERDSLLKIAIGLAVRGYGYDPAENRSPAVNQMIDDMADAGISLSVDTLRKFLRAGSEFLPSERGEERPHKKPERHAKGASSAQ